MTDRDKTLVERARQGNQDAFEMLVRQYEKQVYTLTLRMSRNREDALDLSQEVFLRVYRALPSFRGEASFSSWLYRLTYNACLDHARKTKKRQELSLSRWHDEDGEYETQLSDERFSPDKQWEKKERLQAIARAMDMLSPQHRAILTLREIQGLSYEEIALVLALPEGTIKSRLARAREALRNILTSRGNFFEQEPSNQDKGGESP